MTMGSIFWILALVFFFYLMMRKGGGCCGGHNHGSSGGHGGDDHGGMAHAGHHHEEMPMSLGDDNRVDKDPVCGMEIKKADQIINSEHLGRTFHFCSARCKKLFDLNPGKYMPVSHS